MTATAYIVLARIAGGSRLSLSVHIKEKSADISALLFFMEHPGGIEPPISELQSLALPLGYGCSVKDYSIPRYFFQ